MVLIEKLDATKKYFKSVVYFYISAVTNGSASDCHWFLIAQFSVFTFQVSSLNYVLTVPFSAVLELLCSVFISNTEFL